MQGWAEREQKQECSGLLRMGGDEAQTVSPSVDTAHMVRWPDSDLQHDVSLLGPSNLLCDVNAMAQKHALELPISGYLLAVHLNTA